MITLQSDHQPREGAFGSALVELHQAAEAVPLSYEQDEDGPVRLFVGAHADDAQLQRAADRFGVDPQHLQAFRDAQRAKSLTPDFGGFAGGWGRPAIPFSEEILKELLLILREAQHPQEQEAAFLRTCERVAFLLMVGCRTSKTRDVREQLASLASAARALRLALGRLSADAADSFDALEDPFREPSAERTLSRAFELAQSIEMTTAFAIEDLPLGTQGPAVWGAQALASHLVHAYFKHFGQLPPKDQSSWFVAFATRMGGHLGFNECGPRPVRAAVEALEKSLTSSA